MKIRIEIANIMPKDYRKATSVQRNKFEEIALFLDCRSIQNVIYDFRKRIGLKKTIPYEKFYGWKDGGMTRDRLSRKEKDFLQKLDIEIDLLSNKADGLNTNQAAELDQKEKERLRWLNPFYTFSRALKEKLTSLKSDRFLQLLTKAIVCGEIRNEDFPDKMVTRKGARAAIFVERQLFWLYKTKHTKGNFLMGYGSTGQKLSINLQSARSNLRSYMNKLKEYNSILKNKSL